MILAIETLFADGRNKIVGESSEFSRLQILHCQNKSLRLKLSRIDPPSIGLKWFTTGLFREED